MAKHVITVYNSIKTLIFSHMEVSKWYAPKTWAGLRPTITIRLEEATAGGFKPSGLKADTTLWLSLFPPHSSTCSLADDLEALLDPRLNIGLRR